jgi:L-lysine 6-transaminase
MSHTTATAAHGSIRPGEVLDHLKKYMLIDGFQLVLDLDRSQGCWIADTVTGKRYLDFFSFFASAPLGMNPPQLKTEEALRRFGRVAANNPSNSDFYTVEMAEFVDTLARLARPEGLEHLFIVAGGAPAVENGLKAAFDWKVRKNFARGYREPHGQQVLHFQDAFHGRTGYALSITNTADPRKTMYYPAFDWPRVLNPKIHFPLEGDNLADVQRRERLAVAQIERAFARHPDDIAAIIIEPIQGEGGDNHFRPEFFRELRRLADAHEAMLIFDEVQTGVGMTGKMWAYEHYGVEPDIMVFGKKMQVCGIWVSNRLDEVDKNVFKESTRINSTWGGNLADMVRATEYLRIIHEENLIDHARLQGERLLKGVQALVAEFPGVLHNPRGRGLMVAFDVDSAERRAAILSGCFEREHIIVATGACGIRFRPAMTITAEEIDEGLNRIRDAVRSTQS